MDNLTIIVATDRRNFPFSLPFIYFAAKHNPRSIIDVHLAKDCDKALLQTGIDFVKSHVDFSHLAVNVRTMLDNQLPSFYRFLVEPVLHTQYAYCTDIDIMICEDVFAFHHARLNNGKFCYDNEIRAYNGQSQRMSGLHFCTDEWYQKTKSVRLDFVNKKRKSKCDEEALMKIAVDSNIAIRPIVDKSVEAFMKNRPVHGQHISLSRKPFTSTCHIADSLDPAYAEQFLSVLHEQAFIDLMVNYCPKEAQQIFNTYLKFVGRSETF